MQEIKAREEGNIIHVTVSEGSGETQHRVTVPEALYETLTDRKISKAECVAAAFRFLLERESKEMILTQFDLPVISRYFPEFEKEFKNYL